MARQVSTDYSPVPMLTIASRFPGVSNDDRANATAATIQRGTVSAINCPKSCPAIKWAATTPSGLVNLNNYSEKYDRVQLLDGPRISGQAATIPSA